MRLGRIAATGWIVLSAALPGCTRVAVAKSAADAAATHTTIAGPLRFETLDPLSAPPGVVERATAELDARFGRSDAGTTRLYRAALPEGLELYVVWIDSHTPFDWPSASLIVRRPADDALSPAASRWGARWEREPQPVLDALRVADLEGDGSWQIVYQQREHNGTLHNERTDHYLGLGPDLAFIEVLALAPWTLDLWSLADAGALMRTVASVSRGELLLEVCSVNPDYGDPGTVLGRANLTRNPASGVYELQDTQVLVARYADFVGLRTGSEATCEW